MCAGAAKEVKQAHSLTRSECLKFVAAAQKNSPARLALEDDVALSTHSRNEMNFFSFFLPLPYNADRRRKKKRRVCRTVFASQRAVVESDFLFVPLPLIQDLWKVVVVPSTSPLLVALEVDGV